MSGIKKEINRKEKTLRLEILKKKNLMFRWTKIGKINIGIFY